MVMETFVTLPVKDLTEATEFFTKLGFSFDQEFTDENATRMIVSDDTSVMLCARIARGLQRHLLPRRGTGLHPGDRSDRRHRAPVACGSGVGDLGDEL